MIGNGISSSGSVGTFARSDLASPRLDRTFGMLDGFVKRLHLERILVFASLVLGLLHAWLGRHSMNPDGSSRSSISAVAKPTRITEI
jgi:hypothetical protein